ncbi:MAG: hypothetical protein HY075_02745 [Deltaproteobacteria bacterium]|nr:hypothetical protein [Deltaproteobacteria bacterium]
MTKLSTLLTTVAFFLAPLAARAVDVDLNGFFTVGYARSNTSTIYLQTIDNSGDFARLSNGGLQASASISDRAMVKVQTVATGFPDKSFHLDLDLAQARYLVSSNHAVLLGRLRLPLYLVSDYRMVGALYPWTVPPSEVYDVLPLESVGSNQTFNGGNWVSQWELPAGWAAETELFGGGSSRSLDPPSQHIEAKVKRLFGAEASATRGRLELRASYLNSLDSSTTTTLGGGAVPSSSDTSLGVLNLATAGVRWEPKSWLLQGEFARIFSDNPRFRAVQSHYETLGYRWFSRKLLTQLTFSQLLDSSKSSSSLGQKSYLFGLAYSLDTNFVVKAEVQRVVPTPPPTAPAPPPGAPPRPPQATGLFSSQPSNGFTVYYLSINAAF